MPASSSEGRRAAQASAAPMDDDQLERDANLRKVQARDLVEFGMIPVRLPSFISLKTFLIYDTFPGICWPIPSISSLPQPRR